MSVDSTADRDEADAQRAAETVMRMPEASAPLPSQHVHHQEPAGLSRLVSQSLGSAGRPLDASTRAFMEPRLKHSFSDVRVHTNDSAAATARHLNALAFTLGNHVAFAAGRYDPASAAGKKLIAHELTHVVQQRNGTPRIQRAQVGRIHDAGSASPYFLYELDDAMSRFATLANHYGVTDTQIAAANPGTRATALRLGQQIKVPAVNPPAANSIPMGPPVPALIQSTATHPIPVRWNTGADANQIGRAPRGTAVETIGAGIFVPLGDLSNRAQGVENELRLRGLITRAAALGYVPNVNVRSTLSPTAADDVNLIARMIWGEQRSQGNQAMAAAAWIAKNRYDAGWGSYQQIITPGQFHGLASESDVTGLTGPDLAAWTDAKRIAQEVVDGTIADPTGGVVYFGNGASVRNRMQACARRNSDFTYGNISGTNLYYSNGDYTANCAIP